MTDYIEITDNYRVESIGRRFQPEMLYQCKGGKLWIPLNREGFWADPEAYSSGEITKNSLMGKKAAERSVWLAQKINRVHRP